jgi:hypothetical protein
LFLFYVWSVKVNQQGAKRQRGGGGRGMNLTLTSNSCGSRLVVIFENLWKSFFPLLDPLRLPCQFEVLFIVSFSSSSSFYLSFFIDRKSEFNVNRIVVCVTLAETRALQKNIYFGAKLICEFEFESLRLLWLK